VTYDVGVGFKGLETVSSRVLTMALDTLSGKEQLDVKEKHILDYLYAYVDELSVFPNGTQFLDDLTEWGGEVRKMVKEIQLDPDTIQRNKEENNMATNEIAMAETDTENNFRKAISKNNYTQSQKLLNNATAAATEEYYNSWYILGKQYVSNTQTSIGLVTGLASNVVYDILEQVGISHLIRYVLISLGVIGAVLLFVLSVVMYQYLIAPLRILNRRTNPPVIVPPVNTPQVNVLPVNAPQVNVLPVNAPSVGEVVPINRIKATIDKKRAIFEGRNVEEVMKLMEFYRNHIREVVPRPIKTHRSKRTNVKTKSRRRKRVIGLLPLEKK
jgi:hypothetical protein